MKDLTEWLEGKNQQRIIKEILSKLVSNEDFQHDNLEKHVADNVTGIMQLLRKALEEYSETEFIQSSKTFRQIAKMVKKLVYRTETKGKYSERNSLNDLTGKEWLRHTKSWLIVDGKPSDIPDEIKDHPASFPPDLIEHFVEFFTKKGAWVVDPFIGIGSTLVACQNLSRNCWGTEINRKYRDYALNRINKEKDALKDCYYHVFHDNAHNIKQISEKKQFPLIDLCITSPPYWNILEKSRGGVKSAQKKRIEQGFDEKYSDKLDDLGNIEEYPDYLDNLESVFINIKDLLKNKAYLIVIIQNVRPKNGIMIPIAWDLANRLSKTYALKQEFIWCQDQKFLGIWGYPTTYVSNVHHHYCLVFQNTND